MFLNNFNYYITKTDKLDHTIAGFMSDWDAISFYRDMELKSLGYSIYTKQGGKCDSNAVLELEPLQAPDTPSS